MNLSSADGVDLYQIDENAKRYLDSIQELYRCPRTLNNLICDSELDLIHKGLEFSLMEVRLSEKTMSKLEMNIPFAILKRERESLQVQFFARVLINHLWFVRTTEHEYRAILATLVKLDLDAEFKSSFVKPQEVFESLVRFWLTTCGRIETNYIALSLIRPIEFEGWQVAYFGQVVASARFDRPDSGEELLYIYRGKVKRITHKTLMNLIAEIRKELSGKTYFSNMNYDVSRFRSQSRWL